MHREISIASERIRAGEIDAALAALTRAASDPECAAEAQGHRGWLWRGLGEFEKAAEDYRKLARLQPGNPEVAGLLSESLAFAGQLQEGFSLALETLQRDPRNRYACAAIARCQIAWGAGELPPAPPPPPEVLHPAVDFLESQLKHFVGSVHPDIGRLIYWIVRCLRPAAVIETGAYVGYSSLIIATALRDNGGGHLHSFDLFRQPAAMHPLHQSGDESLVAVVRRQARDAGLEPYATYKQGDSAREIENFRNENPEMKIDLAFIDGDHRMEGCKADFLAVDAALRPGGAILLHDTFPSECKWIGPRWLIETLREKEQDKYAAVNLHTHDGAGLALVQKLGNAAPGQWRPSIFETLGESLFHRKWWPGKQAAKK